MMAQPRKYQTAALRQAAYRKRCAAAHQEEQRQKGLPALPVLPQVPGRARWRAAIGSASALVEQTAQEMREYYEERREVWQESERGEALLETVERLEALVEELSTLEA